MKAWQKALQLLQYIRQSHLLPDVVTFNAALASCAWQSLWRRALLLPKGDLVATNTASQRIDVREREIGACLKHGQEVVG